MFAAGVVQAQSLGDIARKEEERRKTVAAPGAVYTNASLPVVPPPAVPPAAEPQPAAGGAPAGGGPTPGGTPEEPSGDGVATPGSAPEAAPDAGERNEAYWRARIGDEREALRRLQMFAEALQTRINALTADFAARDDPAQRDLIAADRQRSLAELDRIREDIAGRTAAMAAIEEEARRAGVPAGWLR